MRWKSTLVLLAATIGIGAYISLYEIRQPLPEERERRVKRILSIPPETVTQLVFDLPQTKVTLTRAGSMWTLSPNGIRADPELIGQILNHTSSLMAERVLSASPERPLDLKVFGLDPALGWVTLVANGTPTTVLIGGTTPVQDNRYLKISNRPEVFIIPSELFDAVNQPAEAFRDPRLIRVDSWLVDELTMTTPTATCSLLRRDNQWQLTRPFADLADRSEVNALLNRLAGVRIKRFVDDAPQVERTSEWGFDQPTAEITLRQHREPQTTTTLFFGKSLADDPSLVYAKRSDEPPLYAVAAADVDALLKDPHGLRAKACFEFFTNSVTRVEVRRETAQWTIERTGDQWQETGTGLPLEAERVEDFLNTLSDLRLGGFVEDAPSDLGRYGLQEPDGTITVWMNDQEKPQKLRVGAVIEGFANRYGLIDGRDAVVRLPDVITELLATSLDQFRPAAAEPSTQAPSNPRTQ